MRKEDEGRWVLETADCRFTDTTNCMRTKSTAKHGFVAMAIVSCSSEKEYFFCKNVNIVA